MLPQPKERNGYIQCEEAEMTTDDESDHRADDTADESSRSDVPGAPTLPIPAAGASPAPTALPVGLNWRTVADRLGIDPPLLQRAGIIVVAGEYYPEGGYALDPATLRAHFVDIGDMAFRHCYFLGDVAIRDYRLDLEIETVELPSGARVIPVTRGSLIGLFGNRLGAERAKSRILRGSLASGLTIEDGPLGPELHVRRPELPGRVATAMASEGGAIISIAGKPVSL
jgi:hypothetical protein